MNLGQRLSENLHYAWAYLMTGRTLAIVLGILFALLAIALLIASRTRWGKAKPLTKCVVISIVAHLWLLMYASGSRVVLPQGDPNGAMNTMAVSLDASRLEPAGPTASLEPVDPNEEGASEATSSEANRARPLSVWERPLDARSLTMPDIMQDAPSAISPLTSADLLSSFEPEPLPDLPQEPQESLITPEPEPAQQPNLVALQESSQPEVKQPEVMSPIWPPALLEANPPGAPTLQAVSSKSRMTNVPELPAEYQLRVASDRLELARPFGADADTEAAVTAALLWLARNQAADGSWNARQHGGGTETFALGENRGGTGAQADTGVTGLALLAFLSSGHTHRDGDHQEVVRRGLAYLIRTQMPSGDLSGQFGHDMSVTYAKMYCHGIAMLAIAEAYAMTRDQEFKQPLLSAIRYTWLAQDPRGGGWRYTPGAPGDLSQFGWHAMALHSAERSGIAMPASNKERMLMFLDSCATGRAGGLARYRPREGAPSPTMTAEALACRFLLNHRGSVAAQIEARDYLMEHLPGSEEDNIYYWYYGTLALFQLQDESWRRWNVALKTRLLQSQRAAYQDHAGSWDPDRLWGGYGGRVYSTAMGCLCLEVYYRYLPLYR